MKRNRELSGEGQNLGGFGWDIDTDYSGREA